MINYEDDLIGPASTNVGARGPKSSKSYDRFSRTIPNRRTADARTDERGSIYRTNLLYIVGGSKKSWDQ